MQRLMLFGRMCAPQHWAATKVHEVMSDKGSDKQVLPGISTLHIFLCLPHTLCMVKPTTSCHSAPGERKLYMRQNSHETVRCLESCMQTNSSQIIRTLHAIANATKIAKCNVYSSMAEIWQIPTHTTELCLQVIERHKQRRT